MKLVCQITHSQIVSGICPECKGLVGDNKDIPTTATTVWNISAMSLALIAAEDDVQSISVQPIEMESLR